VGVVRCDVAWVNPSRVNAGWVNPSRVNAGWVNPGRDNVGRVNPGSVKATEKWRTVGPAAKRPSLPHAKPRRGHHR
jgi:hypothetical protein